MATYTSTGPGGDVLLYYSLPEAEYMYGCTPTAAAMILGYYDLYGYHGTNLSNMISGTVALKSRGTDGNAYDMDAFDTALGKATATSSYVYRFYSRDGVPTTPEQELEYAFLDDNTTLNMSVWDCLADYLGTGQYWRGNGNLSTSVTYCSLEDLLTKNYNNTRITDGVNTRTITYKDTSMMYGLYLYVQSRGYQMDLEISGSYAVDCCGGDFTFEDYMYEIDSGRPVLVSVEGHSMAGYGYNATTREIIFDDCYESGQRMVWDGTYYYSGDDRRLQSITVIGINVNGDVDLALVNTSGSKEKVILAGTSGALATADYCFAGATVYLTYTVKNTGTKESRDFYTAVRVDGALVSSSSVYSISANSTRKYQNVSLGKLAVGMHNVRVTLDENNDVQELSGANNIGENKILILKSGTSIVSGTKNVNNLSTVRDVYVQGGGTMNLYDGSALGVILRGRITSSSADGTVWFYTGRANVQRDSLLYNTDIYDYGEAVVSSGGTAANTRLYANGKTSVFSGGVASDTTMTSGAKLEVYSGGKVTGLFYGEKGASATFYDGSILDFDLTSVAPGAAARAILPSKLKGIPLYTLTVAGTQKNGKYTLMENAAGFDQTISVRNASGQSLGTLSVGHTTSIGGVDYVLDLADDVLSVTVGSVVPEPSAVPEFLTGCFAGGNQSMLAKQSGGIVTVYRDGATWGAGLTLDPGWDVVGVGDFNNDGRDDFLRVNAEGYVVGEMANSNGTFSPQVLNLKNAGWDILGTGNFDGVGADDVLIANPTGASSSVGLLGYWKGGTEWILINGYSAEWECVATGDFDGDGKCDMLWRNSFVGDGGLTYNAYCTWIVENAVDWRMVSVSNPDEWDFLCAGDFDGNGTSDIAMINDVGVVGIWGVSNGYLSSWSILSAVNTAEWTLAGVGDFNADGTDDIAWSNTVTGLAGYWQLNDKQLTDWAGIVTLG
ncbi:MAG: hypothetical protein J6Y92_00510 [Lentisphaeria bacterium]|nr:hypothetical protein [Lentisphaeria bacterium]